MSKFLLYCTFLGLIGFATNLQAQYEDEIPSRPRKSFFSNTGELWDKENLFIEPFVNLSFSNLGFYIGAQPYIGYSFTDKIAAGFGFGYDWSRINDGSNKVSYGIRYASVFGEFDIFGNSRSFNGTSFFARVEFGNASFKIHKTDFKHNEWYFPIGGGLRIASGGVAIISFSAMYNVLRDANSLFNSPFFYKPSIRWYFLR